MISFSAPIKNSKQCRYYQSMAATDYYANRHEKPGYWAGKGAKLMGLEGQIRPEVLQNLFDGYSPDGATKLVQNAGSPARTKALDATFSPDKSVSTYIAMAAPEKRAIAVRLHDEAVHAAREYWEEHAGFTRRGQSGKQVETAAMVFACFEHMTSRALDPQIHTHLLILNLTVRNDGTYGALHNHELFVHRMRADMIYKVHLALGLRLELGLTLEEEKPSFRIAGVPRELCELFSRRRAAIVEHMQAHGVEGPVAGNLAALATRPAKRHVAREVLFRSWQAVGKKMGWGPEQADNLTEDKKVQEIVGKLMGPTGKQLDAGLSDQSGPSEKTKKSAPNAERTLRSRTDDTASPAPESYLAEPSFEEGVESQRPKPKFLTSASKGRLTFKHERWGEILWNNKLGIAEIRLQRQRLVRKAPGWSPVSNLEPPAIRVVLKRIKLFERLTRPHRFEAKVLWKREFLAAELRVQQQQVFPKAPWWSPVGKVRLPVLRVGRKNAKKTSEPKTNTWTQEAKLDISQTY